MRQSRLPVARYGLAATWQLAWTLLAMALIALLMLRPAEAAERTPFDHLTTGFELTGKHRDLPCESCHVNAIFKGTPRNCAACHGAGAEVRAVGKPANHILASDRCEACHTPVAFNPAVNFDHAEARGSCSTCHNGVQAQGKGAGHIQTDLECNLCHSTIGWAGAVFVHQNITANCASCHDGSQAKGMPANHIPTGGAPCEACHSTTNFSTFAGTPMNHAVVASMPCATCHEAGLSFAGAPPVVTRPPAPHPTTGDCGLCHLDTISFKSGTGQPPNHIPTTQACTLCHSNPADYSVYVMNHQGISANCAQCHAAGLSFANMAPPTLKQPPTNHIPFSGAACESCHSATNFTTFNVANASPPMNHTVVAGVACSTCHASGLSFVGTPPTVAPPSNHIPFGTAACDSCHSATNFTTFVITNKSPPMNHAVVTGIKCSTCHEAGLSFAGTPPTVLRPPTMASGAVHPSSGECSDCHASTTTFKGATLYPSTHIPLPSGSAANCTACHSNPNNYGVYAMDHSVVTTNCATCHAAGLAFANMAPPALRQPPTNHIPFAGAACDACHSATNFTSFVITNKSPPMNHAAVASLGCGSCHGSGLSFVGAPATVVEPTNHIPIGSTPCQNCHSATNFSTFLIANAVPPMNHTGFTTNCISCHGSGLSFVGAPPTRLIPANHIPTGTTACEGCHSNSNFSTFVIPNASGTAPPSMVHTLVTATACSSCHEAGKSFIGSPPVVTRPALKADGTPHVPAGECSTCHFNTTSFKGASDLPANHIPLPAADGANCALCHTTAGNYSIATMNHVNISSNCAQCHASGLSFANMAPPTLKVPPSNHVPFGTAACEGCHAAANFTTFAMTNKSPPMNHAVVASTSCNSCHAQGLSFVGTPATVVEPSNHIAIGSTPCQNCHSATNFSTFVIANAVPPMNHAGFTTNCISCHGVGLSFVGTPATKVFPANHVPTSTIACEGCHSNSNFASFVIPNASGTAPPSMVHTLVTTIACSSCHEKGLTFVGTPAVVVRPALKADGTQHVPGGECNTCHFNTTSFKGATDLPANHIPLPAADSNNCALCHTTAGNYSIATMNHVNITSNCAQCHAYGLSFANMAPPTLVAPPSGTTGHIPSNPPNGTGTYACELCHTPTVFTTFSGTIMKHAVVRGMQCMACHERGMSWKTNTGVRLWVRPSANHNAGQDCGGSGCHSTRDKFAARPATARVQPVLKASGVATVAPSLATGAGPTLSRPGALDHRRVTGACVSCHDQASGIGKLPTHLATSNRCESCHMTLAWLPVLSVDHTQVSGTCVSCHSNGRARSKPGGHLASNDACESCHTTLAWTPARVEHTALLTVDCRSCHNGARAIGMPVNHVPTSAQCSTCHGTLGWKPAKLDHTGIVSNCASCHNNTIALGMSTTHLQTQRDCAICHSYPDWTLVAFTHRSALYPGQHRAALTCVACHTSNSDQIPYAAPAEAGSCGGCHSAAFKPALHPKTADGTLYTAHELRDCTGACHVYKDATLTAIVKSQPGPYHRVADAAFKH
jgi:hypothetical protein